MSPGNTDRRPPAGNGDQNDHNGGAVSTSVTEALDIARAMAAAGIPVFCAYPDPDGETPSGRRTGYRIRSGWETHSANPAYVGAWKPGMALCAVMGQGLDLVDVDPRNGGEVAALNGTMPEVYGMATTPSGGYHFFVKSMGVRSHDGVLTGIDVKAGNEGSEGRGFAFIAPTVRKSKTTGELAAYQWVKPPDLSRLAVEDKSGEKLAELVRQAKRGPTGDLFRQPDDDRREHVGPVYVGEHHAALVSYAGWLLKHGFPVREAEACTLQRLGDLIQVRQDGSQPDEPRPRYTEAEALAELHDVYGRYEAGQPAGIEQAAGIGRQLVVTLASTIKPRPVRWLWNDRLALGALTLLAGREGIGKSLVAVWLAAQLTLGTLPGSRHGKPSRVLFATSEDAWEFTMVPRLLAAGADLSMIGRVQVDDDGLTVGLTLPVDAAGLGDYMASHDVALLILDPLTSVMDGRIDAHRDREVRTALEPLGQLAEKAEAAVLGLVHLGKALGKDPVNLILGSRAFSAVARGAMVAARDPDDEKTNVLSVEKSNLGRIDVPGLTYRIDGAEIPTDEGMASAGLLAWTGETEMRVRDIMADADGDRTERDEAEEWLSSYLIDRNGEATAGDVLKAARADGIAPRTVQRARKRAGVTTAKAGFGGGWVWQLDPRRRHVGAQDASTKDLAPTASSVAPSQFAWPAGSIGEEASR